LIRRLTSTKQSAATNDFHVRFLNIFTDCTSCILWYTPFNKKLFVSGFDGYVRYADKAGTMNNILIIKIGALGDVVMATSLVKQIQDFHSNDKVSLLTSIPFLALFENWEKLSVKAFPRKGIKASLDTIRWIRKQKFSRLYDLQSNDRTRVWCAVSGVSERVGNHLYFPYSIHPDDDYTGQCHIYDRMLDVLACAGIQPHKLPPYMPASNEEINKVNHWINENNISNSPFVILHGGSSANHKSKRWPYYEQLAQYLDKNGYTVIWIGASEDIELNNKLSKNIGINATNKFTISELTELGRHAKFAMTNDSGPMHILSGSGIAVYAFFGPTDWRRNHAIGQDKRVFTLQNTGVTFSSSNKNLDRISLDHVIDRLISDGWISI